MATGSRRSPSTLRHDPRDRGQERRRARRAADRRGAAPAIRPYWPVSSVAVSPDGRWIASGSDDGTIRLWPMPDLSKPPLHTLPHDELLAKLKSLTNLRAVRDPCSDTGWKIEIGPFPGWADVPTSWLERDRLRDLISQGTRNDAVNTDTFYEEQYDFSDSVRNWYSKHLKKQVTLRLDTNAIAYFKALAKETGIPYQNLINLY